MYGKRYGGRLRPWEMRSTRDLEFDTICVNGSNSLPNLRKEGNKWKVRLIEEKFMKRMLQTEGV